MMTEVAQNGDSEVIVERTFRVERDSAEALDAAIGQLLEQPGMTSAELLDKPPGVRVRYDTRELDAVAVLHLLSDLGIRPATGLWQRWRSAWLAMLDGNIKDNAAHRPACCSKPPPGAGRGITGRRH
jgi:hypothetical protein